MRPHKYLKHISQLKVYYGRAGVYISLMNFLMILASFKLHYNIHISAYVIVPIGMVIVLLIGLFDYNFIMKHEIAHSNKQNDIKKQLDEIQKQIKSLK